MNPCKNDESFQICKSGLGAPNGRFPGAALVPTRARLLARGPTAVVADCIEKPDFTAKKTGKEWRLQAAGLSLTLARGGTRTERGGFINLFSS